ncbi:hypothetical protein F5B21DRAFT_496890 [Xylaria acuta]|nr:hypothetical protein F5B21DRAFT_496890 [Xylaria acuta]
MPLVVLVLWYPYSRCSCWFRFFCFLFPSIRRITFVGYIFLFPLSNLHRLVLCPLQRFTQMFGLAVLHLALASWNTVR